MCYSLDFRPKFPVATTRFRGVTRPNFGRNLGVKTGQIEAEFSKIYGEAFESRNESDYQRISFPSRSEAEKAIDSAQRFVERIEKLLGEQK